VRGAVAELAREVGVAGACRALQMAPASFYRWSRPAASPTPPRPQPPLALTTAEEQAVLDVLHADRYVDQAPAAIHATLLEEGVYHCSVRTMYRILARHGEVRDRRDQLRHPPATRPELLATAPNQVWSWDITKLKGPATWTYFYLYVILDIFSRYVVGWLLADRESGALAKRLVRETVEKQGLGDATALTLHSDRGPAMTSKTLGQLLADLSITASLSRPYTSNDNPFSESQFRTLKSRPAFPDRFGSREHGLSFLRPFFAWYNHAHRHSGIGFLTPASVHYGETAAILQARTRTLDAAFHAHPARFKGRAPRPPQAPTAVWINPPALDRDGAPSPRSRQNGALSALLSAATKEVQGVGTPEIEELMVSGADIDAHLITAVGQ
jgi:putative transposase